jgi:hypothetical protein
MRTLEEDIKKEIKQSERDALGWFENTPGHAHCKGRARGMERALELIKEHFEGL